MKFSARYIFYALLALLIGSLLWRQFRPTNYHTEINLTGLGALPVQASGRIMPIDSVARINLLLIAQKDHYQNAEGERREALNWLADLWFDPAAAAQAPIFRIDHPDIKDILHAESEKKKYFSLMELMPHLQTLEEQFQLIDPEPTKRDPYQSALSKLHTALSIYDGLADQVVASPLSQEVSTAEATYDFIAGLGKAVEQPPEDPMMAEQLNQIRRDLQVFYSQQARANMIQPFPSKQGASAPIERQSNVPSAADVQADSWRSLPGILLATLEGERMPATLRQWAILAHAYRNGHIEQFDMQVKLLNDQYHERLAGLDHKVRFEMFLNQLNPFLFSEIVYILAFLLAALSWIFAPKTLRPAAYILMILAFLMHTYGLGGRIYIQERPPVTTLYSSAIFIGWFVILLCWLIEDRFRYGFATAAGSAIGYATLIIAAHLMKQEGDTMGVMRAVLDSNFWLATHVPTVTIGYSATFLAGFLGIIYLLLARIPNGMNKDAEKALRGMVYGTTCFALLFSFVGTVLGGIWADQSWGRFWGWDPKENGALMIVLWGAAMLHARWGRVIGPTGFMQMALVGNIITAWSWFGTNMLGIGLHSYGFMDKAFYALMGFILSQLLLIVIAAVIPPRPELPERL
ncbi:MAG: cytochrome c biogenesis protein CcsA [Verrucomicrobiota bacterium JB022]|nr:cytochrome c biogenesis protein CcsA [Verrucomicrobiota bacterium JB022]